MVKSIQQPTQYSCALLMCNVNKMNLIFLIFSLHILVLTWNISTLMLLQPKQKKTKCDECRYMTVTTTTSVQLPTTGGVVLVGDGDGIFCECLNTFMSPEGNLGQFTSAKRKQPVYSWLPNSYRFRNVTIAVMLSAR